MKIWTLNFAARDLLLDFALLSALFLVATLGRRYVPLFQRYLLPNCLIAGFTGLILGPELLGVVNFSLDRMEVYVYHLLTLTFISIGLQGAAGKRTRGAINFGFIQIMSFLLQVITGLLIALLVWYLLNPNLVPAVGSLLPLGFGMGPGVAYAIGQSWEVYGFQGGGSVGLTIAALGFLVAYGVGIWATNRGIREGKSVMVHAAGGLSASIRTGVIEDEPKPIGARLTFSSGAIEPLTFHLALIGGVYLLSYWLGVALAEGLTAAGLEREINTMWGFHFILANLLALAVRFGMKWRRLDRVIDPGLLHRSTGFLSDILIATSIMAISLSVAWDYAVPVVLMCAVSALITYLTIKWVAARIFDDYHFERFTGAYGQMTGNISSGLALIRVTDPEFETPVAQDLALGSGVALILGAPLFALINLPFTLYAGRIEGYWVVIFWATAYLVLILGLWTRFGLKLKKVASV